MDWSSELLHEKILPIMLKTAVYRNYVKRSILYGSEEWCLKESDEYLAKDKEIHGESNV